MNISSSVLRVCAREHLERMRVDAEKNVLGFDITMAPADGVHGDERSREPARDGREHERGERTANLRELVQIATARNLHDVHALRAEAHVDQCGSMREPLCRRHSCDAASLGKRVCARVAEQSHHRHLVLEIAERVDGAHGVLRNALDGDDFDGIAYQEPA